MTAQAIHVLLEGLSIGVISAAENNELCIGFAFAISSHEILQEIGDTTVLLSNGYSIKEAMW